MSKEFKALRPHGQDPIFFKIKMKQWDGHISMMEVFPVPIRL